MSAEIERVYFDLLRAWRKGNEADATGPEDLVKIIEPSDAQKAAMCGALRRVLSKTSMTPKLVNQLICPRDHKMPVKTAALDGMQILIQVMDDVYMQYGEYDKA